MTTQKRVSDFIGTAVERECVRLAREGGLAPPWTEDPVIATTRLCNVFRDDDRTTRWLRLKVINGWKKGPRSPELLLAIVAFRWFNLIETGEAILPYLDGTVPWRRSEVYGILRQRRDAGLPIFTGAFIINSRPGEGKLENILDCIENVRVSGMRNLIMSFHGMERAFVYLRQFPRLGEFMAYQAVRDLIHTHIVAAKDIDSWMRAGPGCARGLGYVFHDDPEHWSYGSERHQTEMIAAAQDILLASRQSWPWPQRPWTLQEVETWACEFYKITYVRAGRRPKRTFRATLPPTP